MIPTEQTIVLGAISTTLIHIAARLRDDLIAARGTDDWLSTFRAEMQSVAKNSVMEGVPDSLQVRAYEAALSMVDHLLDPAAGDRKTIIR